MVLDISEQENNPQDKETNKASPAIAPAHAL